MARALVVDDSREIRATLKRVLELDQHSCVEAGDGIEALECLEKESFDLILSDVRMPRMDGLELLKESRKRGWKVPFILLTAFGNVADTMDAVKEGAFDYVAKPFEVADLRETIRRALESVPVDSENEVVEESDEPISQWQMVGRSPAVVSIYNLMARIAGTDSTVLIQGETGTGKELVAHSLHANSPRKGKPFVAVNCAAIPETLLESELFGYIKGAFTGADTDRVGLIEAANKGTLFLDEIAEMSPELQTKLLRVLENNLLRRVGDTKDRKVNVRFLCATNQDLVALASSGGFRQDLMYRINVHTITLPPLRHRVGDIALLAKHFLRESSKRLGRSVPQIASDVIPRLEKHTWPGNVRELQHAIDRALAEMRGGRLAAADFHFPENFTTKASPLRSLEEVEREHIEHVLKHTQGNQSEASRILGVDRKTLSRKLKKYGMKNS